MKAYQYPPGQDPKNQHTASKSGIDALQPVDLPRPAPGPNEVLVRIRAVSLNYKDLFVARGIPPRPADKPLIPFSDGAGEVVEAGPGAVRFRRGDRVMNIVAPRWLSGPITESIASQVLGATIDGVLSEYIIMDESALVAIPEHLSYEEASALPCAAVTAWNALAVAGSVRRGDTVLVQGTGGVAIFAVQFAQLLGARVIAISSSDAKLKRLAQLGVTESFNYTTQPEWDQEVLRVTGGRGVDHVIELGGAGTLERSFRSVRMGGTISLIGVLSGLEGKVDPLAILMKGICLQGISVGPRDVFDHMVSEIARNSFHPIIDRAFPFSEARQALQYLSTGKHFGKVVVQV